LKFLNIWWVEKQFEVEITDVYVSHKAFFFAWQKALTKSIIDNEIYTFNIIYLLFISRRY
jgi:hypothetical protein